MSEPGVIRFYPPSFESVTDDLEEQSRFYPPSCDTTIHDEQMDAEAQTGERDYKKHSLTSEQTSCSSRLKVPKVVAEQQMSKRSQLNRVFAITAACLLLAGAAGFLPTYLAYFMKDKWSYGRGSCQTSAKVPASATEQQYGNALISIQYIATIAWGVLTVCPTVVGETFRNSQNYVQGCIGLGAAFMAAFLFLEAMDTHLQTRPYLGILPTMGNALMICFNLFLGNWFIRRHEEFQHKLAMLWACAWTAAPGLARMTNFAQVNLDYEIGFHATAGFSMIMLCLLPSAFKVRDARSWLFCANTVAILLLCMGDISATMHGYSITGPCIPNL